MNEEGHNIELRSREVQDILSRPPKKILRYGTSVAFIIVAVLLIGSAFFEYPDKISGEAVVNKGVAYVEVGHQGAGKIKPDQQVIIKLTAYPYLEFGYLQGKTDKITPINNGEKYLIEVSIDQNLVTSNNKHLEFDQNLYGIADIITENQSFFMRIFSPLKNFVRK